MPIRCCPVCKSNNVRRSMRRGVLESLVLRLLLLRPFRCDSCNNRYYGWFFSKRGDGKRPALE
jgi:hypothetical protein